MQRVGIVGLGKMGMLHAGILNALSDCTVTAICEQEPIISKLARKILLKVSFYNHVSDMIQNEELDAVFVTTPILTHVPIIRSILDSGSKVALFSEKPLAANGADAAEVAEGVAKAEIVNMTGFHKRFSPVFNDAKRLLDGRAIGELLSLKCSCYSSDVFSDGKGWRFDRGTGGALLDLGPHLLDLLLWYFGEPRKVFAVERSFYSSHVDDYVHAIVEFQSKLAGSLEVSWSQRGYRLPEIHIDVQGTNGAMSISDDYVKIQVENAVEGVIDAGDQVFQKPSFNTSVDFLLAEPEYTLEDKHFLTAVAQNDVRATPNFQTAAEVNRFVDLIHRQANEGSS